MIPLVFSDKGTRNSKNGRDAERAIFNALEHINDEAGRITDHFSNSTTMFGFVFHGQKFDQEEIDFVYITIYGLMFVECKGLTNKRQGQKKFKSARDQLKRKVEKVLSCLGLPSDIPIFKVVAFPKLSRCEIANVEEIHVLFKEDLNDLKTWLRRKRFLSRENAIGFDYYVEIATAFLTNYHTNGTKIFNHRREFKTRAISHCNQNLHKFCTKEQLQHLGQFNDLWITGAAGTGKTFLLKQQVKELTKSYAGSDEQNIILVITYNVAINEDIK